jgi:phosphate-selective porin OprO/OprP
MEQEETEISKIGLRCLCQQKAQVIILILLVVLTTPGTGAESPPLVEPRAPTSETSDDSEPDRKDFSGKYQLRLITNAPPAAGSSGTVTNAPKEGFRWDLSWHGWNGIQIGFSHTARLRTPRELLGLQPLNTNQPIMQLKQLKMSARVTGLFELDGAAYATTGNLDFANEIAMRRARIKVQGDCIIVLPVSYEIEVGYVPHKFNLNRAWLSTEHIDYIGYLKFGVYTPPMGLDMLTSSRDLTFMEPATVLQALAPGNEAGIQIGQPVLAGRATWTLGIFGGGLVAKEYGNASQDYGNLIGRITALALDNMDPLHPAENRYLHLGLSANVQYSPSSVIRYRSRPESYLAEHVIDTGDIDAKSSGVVGAEAAYVNGPFSLQGEFLDSVVRQNNGDSLNFWGFYAAASWYVTGESRLYDRESGEFKRLIPLRNFNFGKGGAWGAVELGWRFSYTDLDDADVRGGRISILMGEMNWYLHSHVRWMFNAGSGHLSGGALDGRFVLFQTRIGVDF